MRGGGGGHAWQGGMHGRSPWQGECAWQGVCVAGGGPVLQGGVFGRGVNGRGACRTGGMHAMHPPGRYYEIQSMRGRYASYWNAFLFYKCLCTVAFGIRGAAFKIFFSEN